MNKDPLLQNTVINKRTMDRFADLQTFVRIVTSGSLSGAAEHLDVAKSAVSRRLAELEKRLGGQLGRHPDVEFDLDFNDRQGDLLQEGFDVAIRIAQLPDSSLMARRIAPIHQVVCASPAYFARHGRPQDPAELVP